MELILYTWYVKQYLSNDKPNGPILVMEELGRRQCITVLMLCLTERLNVQLVNLWINLQNSLRLSWDVYHIFLLARMVKSGFPLIFKEYPWFLKWITRAIHFSSQAVSDNWKICPFEFWIIGCLNHKAS